ncbi:OLC1v1009734C1 [Oldenlandia corymbosa var. corymbosa]|uniref:Glycosyltransferase n=1 Tax=Oldenlandia corymbosa var. corymbosa TaxID=529605 RepID=A0AAV1DSX2_OLDCO|nr:OLC1v1009734C1 [Oldenlandia corymbosa var. corymbosa]
MAEDLGMASPHVLIVPFPAQGHVIPLMELAQRIAKHGIRVTFVNTEITHKRILSSLADPEDLVALDDRICLVAIPDGLESDEERKIPGKLSEAIYRVMPGKLEELIKTMNASSTEEDRVTCLIADQSLGWAQELASNLGIRRVAFLPAAAATLVLGFNIPRLIEDGIIDQDGTQLKEQVVQLAPGMPLMNSTEFVWACLGNSMMQKVIFQAMVQNNQVVKLADWLICNSTYDLEPGAFSLAPEIVPIGPLLASNRLGNSAGQFCQEVSSCLNWLDKQPRRAVIYVAFGSSSVLSNEQLEELALGLELSNRPFLWVVPPGGTNSHSGAIEGILSRRMASQGEIVRWAPQQKVLSHPAVACFLSHCGWNSTVESVGNGVPVLCWPYFADQFTNQSYICDIWKVGLKFIRDATGTIRGEEIKEKIDELLENVAYKERALQLQEIMMKNSSEGGSSHKNFTDFISWLKA